MEFKVLITVETLAKVPELYHDGFVTIRPSANSCVLIDPLRRALDHSHPGQLDFFHSDAAKFIRFISEVREPT